MKENLMLIFGGKSVEHDISIITALQIMQNIPQSYNVIPVYVQRDGVWCVADNLDDIDVFIDFDKKIKYKKEVCLSAGSRMLYVKKINSFKPLAKINVALMCLHGGAGEDGQVAALLEMCNIPFTASSHTSSAICMDKIFTKIVLSHASIINVPFDYVTKDEFEKDKNKALKKIKLLGFPIIVKPANLGSSVAIDVVKKSQELEEKLSLAFEFDERVIVEKFLCGSEEYNCACMKIDGDVVSSEVVAVDKSEFFTFDEKYLKNSTKKHKKCEKSIEKAIKLLSKQVYKLLGCDGVVRIDYLVKDEKIYVNEVNTIPGSLSIHMFKGASKIEFIENLIYQAKKKEENKKHLTSSFKSEALQIFKDAINGAKMQK